MFLVVEVTTCFLIRFKSLFVDIQVFFGDCELAITRFIKTNVRFKFVFD